MFGVTTVKNERENNSFGKWLREAREKAELSVRDLGEISGIDHSMLNKVENGYRSLSDDYIMRIAQSFNSDPALLLSLRNNDKQLISLKRISDKKLRFIPGFRPNIEAEVLKYLKVYRKKKNIIKLKFPLNLADIFWVIFGLKTCYESFFEKGYWQLGGIRKLAVLFQRDKIISINTDPIDDKGYLPTSEIQRFSLAHEGAHYAIKLKKGGQFSNRPIFFRTKDLHNKEETTANYWAGAILMPKYHLTEKIRTLYGVKSEKDLFVDLSEIGGILCKEFGVSRRAMEIRLFKLGLKCADTFYRDSVRQR